MDRFILVNNWLSSFFSIPVHNDWSVKVAFSTLVGLNEPCLIFNPFDVMENLETKKLSMIKIIEQAIIRHELKSPVVTVHYLGGFGDMVLGLADQA